MKRFYIVFLLLSLCLGAFSQEITVRFTGQLNNSNYCRLDSVAVTNLSRNWTEMLEYPDTIVVLGGTNDAELYVATTQGLGQNIPNPFDCETRVELSVSQRENVRMQLLDASGKQYADYRGSLDAGVHTFDISAANPQTYILNAVVGDKSYSIRMVNMGSGCGSSIKYAGISGGITAKLTTTNEFQNGDNMHYIGYVTIGSEVVTSNVVEQPQTASEDITLNFSHCQPLAEHVEVTVCDSYEWNNETYTESGDYQQVFTAANGCDSVVTLHLTINHSNTGIDEQTACDSYTWINGETYTASTNEPTYTLTNAAGCDSVVTLHLTINRSNTSIDEQIACDSYTWIDGITYTASTNEPTFTLTNAAGCDSVVTLHLTINHSNTGIDEQTACDSYTWIDGETYTASTNAPTFTLTNAAGCDSVVILHLTINHSNTGIDEQTACDSYTWIDGVTYTESTTEPTFALTNAAGCDSVVTLHLTINRSNTGIDEQTACDSYTWIDGVIYTASTNSPTFTLANAAGCDSVVTLHLTINHSNTGIDEQTACDSYTWIDGVTYTASTNEPTFTLTNAAGCDSVVTLHLTMVCPPTVQTNAATGITTTGATLNGNVTSDGGATVTARGFLYGTNSSDLTQTMQSGSGTGSFTTNLTGLASSTTYYFKAYATNSEGTAYGEVLSFTTLATTGTLNGHDWVDLGLPSGTRWATCNVGASTPTAYGNYYAWGETTSKNPYNWSTYRYCNGSSSTLTKYCNNSSYGNNGFTDNRTTLEASDDAATANWGAGWRMPTYDEMVELKDNCTVTWTTRNGVKGRLFTGPNGNSIFLPAAGNRNGSELYNAGSSGYYRSSSLYSDNPLNAWDFHLDPISCYIDDYLRYCGQSVRPVCVSQN